jgi:hypothetical protein
VLSCVGSSVGCCLQPKERDRVEGGWYAYHPVGGAITVLAKGAGQPTRPIACSSSEAPTQQNKAAPGALVAAKGSAFGFKLAGSKPAGQKLGGLLEVGSSSSSGCDGSGSSSSAAAPEGVKPQGRRPVIEVISSGSSSSGGLKSSAAASVASRDTSLLP